jgi:threonine/homoserine/homoserine lactone efflux protein
MAPADTLTLFFASSLLLALAPGPDNLFVLAQSMQKGRMAGLAVTLGLCTGLLVHTSAVAFGVAAIFQSSQMAFNLLKYLGAAYLLYLAWQSFRAGTSGDDTLPASTLNYASLYRRGIIMNVTNPKVSVFFLAFLPQFTDSTYGPIVPQMLVLGGIFIVATILIFGAVSLLAGTVGERFRTSTSAQKILNRLAGSVFAVLAVKLALIRR